MRRLNFLMCLGIIFFSGFTLKAQVGEGERLGIFLLGESLDTTVRIRWAPSNLNTWQWGLENGYRLSRFTLANNGVRDSIQGVIASKVVLDSLILPLPENNWSNVDATSDQINIAKGAIYSPSFIVDSMIGASSIARAFADQADRENRYVFGLFAADQSFAVAEAMGFGYKDTTALSNKVYYYSIEILGDLDSNALSLFGLEIDMSDTTDLIVPPQPQVEQAVDSTVMISCDVSLLGNSYVSYHVEQSVNNIDFNRVSELPIVASETDGSSGEILYFTHIVDSVGMYYYYRFYGMTPFGEAGPVSPVLRVKTSPSPKASPPIITDLTIVSENVKVDWTFPSTEDTLISKFRIYRSKNPLGPYNLLDSVAVTVRTWTDDHPINSGYYRIAAFDKALVEVYGAEKLMQLKDSIPPDAPSGLSCNIDFQGIVTVAWSPVEDPGLQGYRVFSGNAAVGIYGEETNEPVTDTIYTFQTNLQTLTEALYVKLQAVDLRENYSEYSAYCMALRPDILAPSRPILSKANPLVEGISLQWINSSSDDVVKHQLQRRWVKEAIWVTLLEFDTSGTVIGTPVGMNNVGLAADEGRAIDTLAAYPRDYEYRLLAVDEAENSSSSEILGVRPYDSGLRGTITNLDVDSTFDAQLTKDVNILSWNYSHLAGLYDFQIYRSVDHKPMRAYATTNGRGGINFADVAATSGLVQPASGTFNWKDAELGTARLLANSGVPGAISGTPMQRTFKYKIMARHFDGGYSPVSEEIEIEVWVPGE